MTSAENNVSEPPNLKMSGGEDIPRPRYKARGFCTRENAPVTKNLATALR